MIKPLPAPSLSSIEARRRNLRTPRRAPLTARRLTALALLASLAAAGPALAQSSGVGGQIGGFIQNIVDLLNSSVIRGLATIAVILTGIVWMFGHIDMRRAGTVVVGIIVIFSAAAIVDLIVGAG
nr:TrbC/VirB2 family protein [Phenylobacterium sp.]|tara:strand:+ start:73308 stop:73682 length:375 start_codon:yes stop_codon:yes gene_type:complete